MESKKTFTRIGIILGSAIIAQLVLAFIMGIISKQIWGADGIPELFKSVFSLVLMDGIILPAMCFAFSRLPEKQPQKDDMSVKDFFMFFALIYGLSVACNYVTVMINGILMELTGHGTLNSVLDLLNSQSQPARIVTYVFAVIIAPIMEELTFRRFLLTRMLPYGEKVAIITSGVMFGLFHGNISQALYAAVLGIGLGYMYVRTGNIRNNILLHMCVNSLATIAAILLQINIALGMVFSFGMVIFGLWGITIFINHKDELHIEKNPEDLGILEAWKNIGFLIFFVAVIIEIVYSFWVA